MSLYEDDLSKIGFTWPDTRII